MKQQLLLGHAISCRVEGLLPLVLVYRRSAIQAASMSCFGATLRTFSKDLLALMLQVSMSNWEARNLDPGQLQYAALDVLLTGHVFRCLRLWHSAPSVCATCLQTLGEVLPKPRLLCMHVACTSKSFSSLAGLEAHTRSKLSHFPSVVRCSECGRIHPKRCLPYQ